MPDPQDPFGSRPYVPIPTFPGGQGVTTQPQQSGELDPFGSRPYQPLPPVEPSWPQTIISNALSVVPAIGGAVGGFFAGGPVGGIAGGAGGAGIGADLRQRYEMWQTDDYGRPLRQEYNPWVTAVETGLGAIPGVTKFPGFSAGVKELAKYGAKTFGESAVISAAGTPLQYAAETGEWNAPSSAYLTNALVGGTLGTATGFGLEGALRPRTSAAAPSLPREAAPGGPSFDVPFPPSPYNVELPELRQPSLPGMDAFRNVPDAEYGPTPFQPTGPPSIGAMQGQGFAAIDAKAQQQIFELTLDRAEAQRAGNSANVLAIEQAILEIKMNVEAQKRNWTIPPESPAPVFPGMPDAVTDQGDLAGFAWRQGGRFTQPGNIPPEMRQGVLGPEVTGGPRYPPAEPSDVLPYPPQAPWNTAPDVPPQGPGVDVVAPAPPPPSAEAQAANAPAALGGLESLPKYVEIPNMSDHAFINEWVGRGYLPGGPISARGFPQLMRPDVAPTVVPTPPKSPTVAPTRQGAFQPGQRGARDEEIVPASLVNNEYIARMRKGGYEIAIRGPEEVVFRKVKGEPILSSAGGGGKPSPEMSQILLRIFQPDRPLREGSLGEFEVRRAVNDILSETNANAAFDRSQYWQQRVQEPSGGKGDYAQVMDLLAAAQQKYRELIDATMRSPEAANSANAFNDMMNKAMAGAEQPYLADIIHDIRNLAKQDTPQNRAKTDQLVDLFERRIRAADPSARQLNHNETRSVLRRAEEDPNSTPAELGLLRTLVDITGEVATSNAPPVPMTSLPGHSTDAAGTNMVDLSKAVKFHTITDALNDVLRIKNDPESRRIDVEKAEDRLSNILASVKDLKTAQDHVAELQEAVRNAQTPEEREFARYYLETAELVENTLTPRVREGNVTYDREIAVDRGIEGVDRGEYLEAKRANLSETRRMLQGWVENLESSINDAQRHESNVMIETLRRRERELTEGVQGELPFGPLREQFPVREELPEPTSGARTVEEWGPVQRELPYGPPDRWQGPSREPIQSRTGGGMDPKKITEHPIVKMFQDGLPNAKDYRDTRFILPDGTRKTHNQAIHAQAAEKVGTSLRGALGAGVIRFEAHGTGAEIGSRITHQQAEVLADSLYYNGGRTFYLDIRTPDNTSIMRSERLRAETSADDIYKLVNDSYSSPTQSRIPPATIIKGFRENLMVLEGSNNWRATRFILPDGTRLHHMEDIHDDAAQKAAGTSLYRAMEAGIIRTEVGFDSAEVMAPITEAQADILADAIHFTGRGTTVEVWTPEGRVSKRFDEDSTGGEVYDWVNSQFSDRARIDAGIRPGFLDRMTEVIERRNAYAKEWNSMAVVGKKGQGLTRESSIWDVGGKLTKDEKKILQSDPLLTETHVIIDAVVHEIIEAVDDPKLRRNIVRTGTVLDPSALAVYLPQPVIMKDRAAVLINTPEHLKLDTPENAAIAMVDTIFHELAHGKMLHKPPAVNVSEAINDPYVGRFVREYLREQSLTQTPLEHAADWLDRMVYLYERTGPELTAQFEAEFRRIFSGSDKQLGGYDPKVQTVLSIYTESRRRAGTSQNVGSGEGIKSSAPNGGEGAIPSSPEADGDGLAAPKPGFATRVKQATGWGQGSVEPPKTDPNKPNFVQEAINFPTNATTIDDLSFPGRQGLSQIFTPEFWKAAIPAISAAHKGTADRIDAQLKNKELFQDRFDPMTGEFKPSIAKEDGLDLMALGHQVGPREEATSSRWIENGAFLGPKKMNPFRFLYNHTLGYPARATNRIFTTWGNHLRANRYEKLMNLSRNMSMQAESGRGPMQGVLGGYQLKSGKNIGLTRSYTSEEAANLNPFFNRMRGKEIAEFVNTATGRGPLKTHVLPFRQTQISLESSAKTLSMVMFAPRNTASRIRMLNPSTYIMASPFVRRQYLKAALSTGAAWFIFTELAKMADPRHVKVNHDLTSADFGKVRIGDFRMDAAGGFQQFLVAYSRLFMGGATSSATGKFNPFGKGFQAQTQFDMGERLFSNKLNPVAKFAWDLAHASEYNPFHVGDRAIQLFVPLIVQDFVEIQKEDPDLLMPWMVPILFGAGSQIYSKGESISKFVKPKNDWLIKGGGLIDLLPKDAQNLWDKSGRF